MTNRLDDKIRAFVLELVDDPPPAPEIDFEAMERTAQRPLHQIPPQRRATVPVVAIVGAALLVLVAVGIPVLLFGGGESAVVDTSATTVVTTTTPPPTTVAPSPLTLPDAWQRVGASVMTPVVGLFDMAETSSGLVAVGFDPGEEDSRQNGVVFGSSDGVTWTRLAEDEPALNLGSVLIYGITEGGPGIVAVGTGCEDDTEPCMPHPTVWTSIDGTAWTRSPADADVFGDYGALLDVVATEHGIIAAGGSYTSDGDPDTALVQPTVWLSPDGIDWERVWQGEAYDYSTASVITAFQALATGADGRVVGVGTAINDQGDFVGAIWTSTDGRNWERIDRNSDVFTSHTGSDVSILDVAAGPDGFVAVGSDGSAEVAIWHSPDGLTWTRADTADQPFEYIGTLSAVDALDTGWVIAGPHGFADMTGGTVTLWTSPDGLNWDRVHSIGPGYAMSIVATDSGIAVAGAMAGVDDYYAAVWAGPTFDPAAPTPDPGPTPPADDATPTVAEEGLSCEELVDLGYGYEQVVSYWLFYPYPGNLDPDDTGAPCAHLFPEATVEAISGGSDALPVEINVDWNTETFAATGPAVDADLICATGTLQPLRGDTEGYEITYICDDESGSFTYGFDLFFYDTWHESGVWNIAAGTDERRSLMGGGGATDLFYEETDLIIGRLWLTDDEN